MLYNICAIFIHINVVRYIWAYLLPYIYTYTFRLAQKYHTRLWTKCCELIAKNLFNYRNIIVHLSQENEKEESDWKMMVRMVGRGTLSVNKTCYASPSWTDSCSSFRLTFCKRCEHLHLFINPKDYRELHANHRILTIIRLIGPPCYLCSLLKRLIKKWTHNSLGFICTAIVYYQYEATRI